jgi:hypothetical protein
MVLVSFNGISTPNIILEKFLMAGIRSGITYNYQREFEE